METRPLLPHSATYLITKAKTSQGDQLERALEQLWKLTHVDTFKVPLGDDSVGFIELLSQIVRRENGNIYRNALGCLWFLSRVRENKAKIGSEKFGLLPLLIENLRVPNMFTDITLNIFINCSLDNHVHSQLFSPEIDYFSYCSHSLYNNGDELVYYIAVSNIISNIQESYLHHIYTSNIIEYIYNRLILSGPIPTEWENRFGGVEYWCLNFLMDLSSLRKGKKILKLCNKHFILIQLVDHSTSTMEGIKAICTLFNIFNQSDFTSSSTCTSKKKSFYQEIEEEINQGSQDSNDQMFINSFLLHFPEFLANFFEIYEITLNGNQGPLAQKLRDQQSFVYGILSLKIITGTLLNLSYSNNNKRFLLKHIHLIPFILQTIRLFIDNKPQLYAHLSQISYAGGGGDDYETLNNCIELLLQLAFFEENSQAKSNIVDGEENEEDPECLLRTGEQIVYCLDLLLALPPERSLSIETKMMIRCIRRKLNDDC
jgi:hypothetical protein